MAESTRKQTSFRLTAEAARLAERLAQRLGVNKTAVWELAIRRLARQEGIGK